LTWEEWIGWKEMWFASPWGEYRQDIRFEQFLIRFMLTWAGKDDDTHTAVYPYVTEPESLEEVKAAQKHAEDGLEEYVNAAGRLAHRWKPGYGPLNSK
jgi:hypothetical protein